MQKKVTIASVFPGLENIHLVKDVGMIPFSLKNYYEYNAIIPFSSQHKYDYKTKYFSEIETPIIKDKSENINRKYLSRLFWVIKNAERIDLLHVYFLGKWTWIYIYFYQKINKNGLVYVHLDSDGSNIGNKNKIIEKYKKNIALNILHMDKNLKYVLWGIQNYSASERLKDYWPYRNLKFIPNGFFWDKDIDCDFGNKDNIILTVSRNGSPQKRTDLLLNAFLNIADEFPDWSLKLIGTVEESFKDYINNFFKKNPQMIDRVVFVGQIDDRDKLQEEYSKAKIFALPSKWESFGLVAIEAMSMGCYFIGSDIPSNIMLTNNGKMGTLFKSGDIDDFTFKLKSVIYNKNKMAYISKQSIDYANEYYSWKKNVGIINDWVMETIKDREIT